VTMGSKLSSSSISLSMEILCGISVDDLTAHLQVQRWCLSYIDSNYILHSTFDERILNLLGNLSSRRWKVGVEDLLRDMPLGHLPQCGDES